MDKDVFEHKFREIVNNGLKEGGVPSATLSNSMITPSGCVVFGFRPNNYRRGVLFVRGGNSGSIGSVGTIASHSRLQFVKGGGVTLMVGREKIVAIYDQAKHLGKKYWYRIERDSVSEVDRVIEAKKEELKCFLDSKIKDFASKNGLELSGEFFWVRAESGIKGDSFLDSLPEELIVHDSTFRKVYKDEVEFISGKGVDPVAGLKNFVNNRALEAFSPAIVEQLNLINYRLSAHEERALKPLTAQIELHLDVMRKMNVNLTAQNEVLGDIRDHVGSLSGGARGGCMLSLHRPTDRCGVSFDSPPIGYSMPRTFSKYDVWDFREARLLRVRRLLYEYGWGESRWT